MLYRRALKLLWFNYRMPEEGEDQWRLKASYGRWGLRKEQKSKEEGRPGSSREPWLVIGLTFSEGCETVSWTWTPVNECIPITVSGSSPGKHVLHVGWSNCKACGFPCYFTTSGLPGNKAKLNQHQHNNYNHTKQKRLSAHWIGSRWRVQAPAKETIRTSICENASD